MAQTKEEKNTKERDRYHNRGGKQKLQKKRSTPEWKEQRKKWYEESGNGLEKIRRSKLEYKKKLKLSEINLKIRKNKERKMRTQNAKLNKL